MKKQAFLLLPHPQTFPNALDTSHSVLGHPKILAAIFSLGKGGGREAHPPALFSLHPFQRSFKTGADQKDHNRDVENRKRLVWERNHQQKIGEKKSKKGMCYSTPVSKSSFPIFNVIGIIIKYY